MSGYYKKAPLVFMNAILNCGALPPLSVEQRLVVNQALFKLGLVHFVDGSTHNVQLTAAFASDPNPTHAAIGRDVRIGYMSSDRSEALIFTASAIEYRTTKYTQSDTVFSRIKEILVVLGEVIELYNHCITSEIIFSYADVIMPLPGRKLSDYFANGESALPISMFEGTANSPLQQSAHVQYSRIVTPNLKVYVSIEQIPIVKGFPLRLIPEIFFEPLPALGQDISLRPEWVATLGSDAPYYVLLVTQAAMLFTKPVTQVEFNQDARILHDNASDVFRGLINKPVCDIDWEYTED